MIRSTVVMALAAVVGLLAGGGTTAPLAVKGDTPPVCTQTTVRKGPLGAAAGSAYQTFRVRNVSDHSCSVPRLPRVAYVNRFHHMIGWPAKPQQSYHRVLHPGQVARFVLQAPAPGNFRPADCLVHRAPKVRVTVADDNSPTLLHWDRRVCTTRFARSSTRRPA